ncbi:uncharacterized protein LOC136024825 isoform X2 [Artemia franciscana]|uniref:uncharacterized protein LOC136024825 isoform X2 n=1 Tax=Artemia franciscana TaxID=6661 RepID=UPI0032DAD552
MKAFALFKKVAIMYLPFYICLFVVCIFIYKSKGTIIKNISAQYDLKTVVEPCKITSYEQMRNIFFNSKKEICKEHETWGGVNILAKFIEENIPKRQRRLAGNYTVCLDKDIAPPKKGCLIYSFGINFDWTFEERAEDYGCQVLAFDPSMAVPAHHHSLNIFLVPKVFQISTV